MPKNITDFSFPPRKKKKKSITAKIFFMPVLHCQSLNGPEGETLLGTFYGTQNKVRRVQKWTCHEIAVAPKPKKALPT